MACTLSVTWSGGPQHGGHVGQQACTWSSTPQHGMHVEQQIMACTWSSTPQHGMHVEQQIMACTWSSTPQHGMHVEQQIMACTWSSSRPQHGAEQRANRVLKCRVQFVEHTTQVHVGVSRHNIGEMGTCSMSVDSLFSATVRIMLPRVSLGDLRQRAPELVAQRHTAPGNATHHTRCMASPKALKYGKAGRRALAALGASCW
jgi:hypothetical protein